MIKMVVALLLRGREVYRWLSMNDSTASTPPPKQTDVLELSEPNDVTLGIRSSCDGECRVSNHLVHSSLTTNTYHGAGLMR